MCGIAGFVSGRAAGDSDYTDHLLRKMGAALSFRGPDGEGRWVDSENGVAFVHRRLAIVDLSPTGFQPMASPSGRYMLIFNGEIYNHQLLRRELNVEWRGTSDTETMLAAIDAWGIVPALQRLKGMFAFALWDHKERKLILARDRLGEKPMYYGWQGSKGERAFLFGSDLAALKQHPAFEGAIDRDALCGFMRQGNVPGRSSIHSGIRKLLPGRILTLEAGSETLSEEMFWSASDMIQSAADNRFEGSFTEAADTLERMLKEVISRQMIADVPLGAFLSGGVDSSAVVALMQVQMATPVRTFSIGFDEEAFNEAPHAKAVAAHLGTHHTELTVTARDALEMIPNLPAIYTEPFADASQIPTYLLSQLTRREVTVALSGDGGDELFAGYNRHRMIESMWPRLSGVPVPLRKLMATTILAARPQSIEHIARIFGTSPHSQLADKLQKAALALSSSDLRELHRRLVAQWPDPESVVIDGHDLIDECDLATANLSGLSPAEHAMARDLTGYLPDDVLTKVDRAAMAASLEARVPMLDHDLVAFAFGLPLEFKLQRGQTKRVLREVLYRHVPRALIERPKTGFGVPIDAWLRGPLRGWAEDLLSEDRLKRQGYLKPEPIRKKWDEHLSGKRNWQHQIWNALMFQAWLA